MRHRENLRMAGGGMRRMFVLSMLLALACSDDGQDGSPVEEEDAGERDSGPDEAGEGGSGGRSGNGGSGGRSGNGGSGGRGGNGGSSGSSGEACGDAECKSPATCSRDGEPHCVCPDGYKDVKNDGSQCDDVDECKDNKDNCDPKAACTNTPGSFTCECKGPAYKGDGKTCECSDGYTKSSDGLCLASNGKSCGDDLDCATGNCEGKICCAVSCDNPGNCQTTEGATCEGGETCKYPTAGDGAACDDGKACTKAGSCKSGSCEAGTEPEQCDDNNPCTDDSCAEPAGCTHVNNTKACDDGNPCTTTDACLVGTCQGSAPRDCSAQDNTCNKGECNPANGECRAVPRQVSVMCNDNNSCTLMDMCMGGACMGSGNACRQNATSCTPGTPNTCVCKDGFVNEGGVCVPNDNECDGDNVCSEFADCFDPSNVGGDVMCTCRAGYTGNGTQCTQTDPCADNPCGEGRGTCTAGTAGAYTCSCAQGYKSVAGSCVCDMAGTFAVRTELGIRWTDVEGGIDDGSGSFYTYLLERHTYDAAGKLSLEIIQCGSTSFDLCGSGQVPLYGAEAYSEFYPAHIWDLPSMPKFTVQLDLPKALPGEPFKSPNYALLHGVTLTDPLGAWPPTRADIAGSSAFDGSAVNGAAWVDHDSDNQVAITDVMVPPGGIRSDGVNPEPITQFGATSATCSRAYSYWPALPESGLSPVRVSRAYTAARVIQGYDGSITSCDAYGGSLSGNLNNRPRLDARIGGCMRINGSTETNCAGRSVDSLDGADSNQEVVNATFKAKRMTAAGNITCDAVRKMNFD
jgi:EGF domain